MAIFHRLALPTYHGGLPVDYDYINDPVANGYPGSIPAFFDGIKVGGSCEGTYLVAFGEEASSANANRGMIALALNTDYLDDLLHRDIAAPYQTLTATSGGAVISITLPAGTYVGGSVSYGIENLFSLLDNSNNEIITSGGVEVKPTSISGASIGDGFSSGIVTVNLNAAIPNGVQYKLLYAARSNLAELPADAFITNSIRAAEEVDADVKALLQALQGNSYAWNHAWEGGITIYALAWRGLAGLYNKSTTAAVGTPPTGYTDALDTAGAGAWFEREGPAMLGQSSMVDGLANSYKDVGNSIWSALNLDEIENPGNGTGGLQEFCGGTVGFTYVGNRLTNGDNEYNAPSYAPGFAAFFAGAQSFQTVGSANSVTRIVADQAGSLALVSNEWVLTLSNTNSHFWKDVSGDKLSAIAVGYDMLDIVHNGGKRARYVIVQLDSSNNNKCVLQSLDGGTPQDLTNFIAGSCTIERWIRAYFSVADGSTQYRSFNLGTASKVKHTGFFVAAPPSLSGLDDGLDFQSSAPAAFFAARSSTLTGANTDPVALAWGGYTIDATTGTGTYEQLGYLYGDGSLASPAITANSHFLRRTYKVSDALAALTFDTEDSTNGGAAVWWSTTNVSTTLTAAMTNLRAGGTYVLWIRRKGSTVTYPAQWVNLSAKDTSNATITTHAEGWPLHLGACRVQLSDASGGNDVVDQFIFHVTSTPTSAPGGLRCYVEHHTYQE